MKIRITCGNNNNNNNTGDAVKCGEPRKKYLSTKTIKTVPLMMVIGIRQRNAFLYFAVKEIQLNGAT